jgi:hypothetical protein
MAEAYVVGANLGGHQVEAVALRDLRFDLVLRGGYRMPSTRTGPDRAATLVDLV